MQISKDLCLKFPSILRDKLLQNEIEFPDTTQFTYEDILTYRAVSRNVDDYSEVTLDDFKSYFELGKTPKKVRGNSQAPTEDPCLYGVSSFLKKEIVEQVMKFPRPNKKMAYGYVYCIGGPQNTVDQHVCWWLYDGADVSGFKLMQENENE